MMDWYDGMGWGSWLIACLMMLAFLALVVVIVMSLASGARGSFRLRRSVPKDVLDERLARGDIDIEEYPRTRDAVRKGEDLPRMS